VRVRIRGRPHPTKASPELGRLGIQFKIDVTLEALKKSMAAK
jgi:hypothetical protein